MKQATVQNIFSVGIALVVATFLLFAQTASADTLNPRNTTKAVTGVESASSTAVHTSEATAFAGESDFFDRLMTMLNCTPNSTTTDTIISVGTSNLAWFWISGQQASSSFAFYDGVQVSGEPKIAEYQIVGSSTGAYPIRTVGAGFTNGIYVDLNLGTQGRLNYCYL